MKRLLIAVLLVLMFIPTLAWCGDDSFGPIPHEIYWENVYYQQTFGDAHAGNPIGHAQLLIDGDKSLISEGQGGVILYADQMINGTAAVNHTPFLWYNFSPPPDPTWPEGSNYSTKAATILNGVMYSQDMHMRIHKATIPTGQWDVPAFVWSEPGMETGRVESDCTGLVTDGTYLYGSDNPGAFAVGPSYIYKWSVDPTANGGQGALTEVWKKEIPTATWLISIGYYNGKLYAAEGFRGRNIYEIDCSDGAYQTLLSGDNLIPEALGVDSWYMGQIARCGDTIVLANWSGHLTQWKLIAGTWTKYSCWRWHPILEVGDFPLRMHTDTGYFLGLSLKPGPDGNAKYAWTSASNVVSFWDLDPDWTLKSLGEARKVGKNGYPVAVQNAVVTKVGTGEFWVEDVDRASGCRVAWGGTMPTVGNLVTMKGGLAVADSGEKAITATEVVDTTFAADPAIKPLYVSNKNLGPAAGSAGLATDGMLVKVTGMLTLVDPYDAEFNPTGKNALYIDDGSAVANDKEGAVTGLKVTTASLIDVPDIMYATPGSTEVTVTGIVRLEKLTDGTVIRKIEALSDTDIVLTTL